jgi:hypothetical protein
MLQRLGKGGGLVLIDALYPKLKRRDRRRVQRPRQSIGKAASHLKRRDQVELAGAALFTLGEQFGE